MNLNCLFLHDGFQAAFAENCFLLLDIKYIKIISLVSKNAESFIKNRKTTIIKNKIKFYDIKRQKKIVDGLLERGCTEILKDIFDLYKENECLAPQAIYEGNVDFAKWCISHGKYFICETFLAAIKTQNTEICELIGLNSISKKAKEEYVKNHFKSKIKNCIKIDDEQLITIYISSAAEHDVKYIFELFTIGQKKGYCFILEDLAKYNRISIIEYLLHVGTFCAKALNKCYQMACRKQNLGIIKYFRDNHIIPDTDLFIGIMLMDNINATKNFDKWSSDKEELIYSKALELACESNSEENIDYLIGKGITNYSYGLSGACRSGNYNLAEKILSFGVLPNDECIYDAVLASNQQLFNLLNNYMQPPFDFEDILGTKMMTNDYRCFVEIIRDGEKDELIIEKIETAVGTENCKLIKLILKETDRFNDSIFLYACDNEAYFVMDLLITKYPNYRIKKDIIDIDKNIKNPVIFEILEIIGE